MKQKIIHRFLSIICSLPDWIVNIVFSALGFYFGFVVWRWLRPELVEALMAGKFDGKHLFEYAGGLFMVILPVKFLTVNGFWMWLFGAYNWSTPEEEKKYAGKS